MKQLLSGRQPVFAVAALLIVLFAALFYFTRRQAGPYHAVPSQAAFVFEFDGLAKCSLLKKNAEDPLWAGIFGTTAFENAWNDAAAAAALFGSDPALQGMMANGKSLVALTLNKADSLHGLVIFDTGEKLQDVVKTLKNNALVQKVFPSIYHGHTIYTVYLPQKDRVVVSTVGSLLLVSRFSYLIEDAITQINGTSSWWADRRLLTELDANSPFRIYLRMEMIASQYARSMHPAWKQLPEYLEENIAWIGFAWNGLHTRALAETRGFLGGMNDWGGSDSGALTSVLPDNTALALRAAFSSPKAFFRNIKTSNGPDFDQFVLPWTGEEVVWGITEPFSQGLPDDQFYAIAVRDSVLALESLRACGRERGVINRETYQTYEVFQYANPSIMGPLAGPGAGFGNPCCAMIGGYVIFTNNRAAVELMIDKYIVSQNLANNTDYLQLQQKISPGNDGAWLFVAADYLPSLVKSLLDQEHETSVVTGIQAMAKTGLVAVKIRSRSVNTLEMDMAAQPRMEQSVATSILWKTPLAADAITQPFLINGLRENAETAILVQDAGYQLYRLDAGGAVVWRRQTDGPVLSAIRGIDFRDNRQNCYLFNTANKIWLLDDEGRDVEGFPLTLLSPATNGMTLIDFDNNLKFNYFIACANGNVYGFDRFGRPLPGWNPQEGVGRVVQPLLHFQHDHKDYLAVINKSGKMFVFGRNGAGRFPAVQFGGADFGPLQADVVSNAPRIVCANGSGQIFVCNLDGNVFGISSGTGGRSTARLAFLQMAGDARLDYAIAQGGKVMLRGYKGGSIHTFFSTQMPSDQDTVFSVSEGLLGTMNKAGRQIFLLDGNGHVHPDFPLAGTTPFSVSNLIRRNAGQVLVVGDGRSVYAYKIR